MNNKPVDTSQLSRRDFIKRFGIGGLLTLGMAYIMPKNTVQAYVSDNLPKETPASAVNYPNRDIVSSTGVVAGQVDTALSILRANLDDEKKARSDADIDLTSSISSLKKSVSDGKSSIASAITNQGVTTAADATFATMSTNVGTVATNKYNAGYSKGITDADNRANASSTNYKTGYNSGYSAGVTAADNRANADSVNYKTGYNAGVTAADNRANVNSTNYKTGYNKGVTDADNRANANSTNYKTGYNSGYSSGYNKGVTDADGRANTNSTNYQTGYNAGVAAGTVACSYDVLYSGSECGDYVYGKDITVSKDYKLIIMASYGNSVTLNNARVWNRTTGAQPVIYKDYDAKESIIMLPNVKKGQVINPTGANPYGGCNCFTVIGVN